MKNRALPLLPCLFAGLALVASCSFVSDLSLILAVEVEKEDVN